MSPPETSLNNERQAPVASGPEQPVRPEKKSRSLRKRLLGWTILGGCSIVLLLVIAWQVVTSSWFLRPRIESLLSSMLGGRVTIGSASLSTGGQLDIRNLVVRVPDLPGAAGDLVSVPHMEMTINRDQLWRNHRLLIENLVLDQPLFRLSESMTDHRFNISMLNFAPPQQDAPPLIVPRIDVNDAVIQVGSEDKTRRFTPSGSIHVTGSIKPERHGATSRDRWFSIDLVEVASKQPVRSKPLSDPIRLSGRFNLATGAGSSLISGLTFQESRAGLLPPVARQWWDLTHPSGHLEPVAVSVEADGNFRIEIAMDGIDWSIPVPAFNPESHSSPRVTDTHGTVVIHNNSVELVGVTGVIDRVRYRLHGGFTSIDASPGLDLTFEVQDFNLEHNLNVLTALPESLRDTINSQLLELGGPSGLVSARVAIHRDPLSSSSADSSHASSSPAAQSEAARPVTISGRVELSGAATMYAGFPYPLTGVSGAIEFTQDAVHIVNLAGTGPTGGEIFLSGAVTSLGPQPQVDIDMYGVNIPIDDALRSALGQYQSSIDLFINKEYEMQLQDAGLITTPEKAQSLREQAVKALAERRRLQEHTPEQPDTSYDASIERSNQEIAGLNSELKKPVFTLGGKINIRSHITHLAGSEEAPRISTVVSLSSPDKPIGVLYTKFPVPLQLISGELTIDPDRITISREFNLISPGGAHAVISGYIGTRLGSSIPDDPHISLSMTDVPIDTFLLHAIPEDSYERGRSHAPWPGLFLSHGAQILGGLDLNVRAHAAGKVFADPAGKVRFHVDIGFENGSTFGADDHNLNLAEARQQVEWRWPDSLPLTDISAHAILTDSDLTIDRFEAQSAPDQHFSASASIDWSKEGMPITMRLDGQNVVAQVGLLALARALAMKSRSVNQSQTDQPELEDFWNKFEPQGTFGFRLNYQRIQSQITQLQLDITPIAGSLMIAGSRVNYSNPVGSIRITPDEIHFNDVSADLSQVSLACGRVHLAGVCGWDESKPTDLSLSLKGGRFESPVIRSLIAGESNTDTSTHALNDTGHVPLRKQMGMADLDPVGAFDAVATFRASEDHPAQPVLRWTIEPESAQFTWHGQRFIMDHVSGSVTFDGTRYILTNLGGAYQDGAVKVGGVLDISHGLDAQITLDINADSLSDRVIALLPKAADDVIKAIDLSAGTHIALHHARIEYLEDPPDEISDSQIERAVSDRDPVQPDASRWRQIAFKGMLDVTNASMNVSIPVTDFTGSLLLDISRRRDNPWISASVALDVNSMRAMGRQLTNVTGRLHTTDKPREIILQELVGDCYGGRVAAHGELRIPSAARHDPGSYAMWLTGVDVNVGPVIHNTPSRSDAAKTADQAGQITSLNQSDAEAKSDTRGEIFASLSLTGRFGEASSRRGRGEMRIINAELFEVPLAMWALQLSSLTLPVSTSFDYADISFFIDGNDLVFERLHAESPGISLNGEGTLTYPGLALDLRFHTSSNMAAPIITPVWEGIRDLFASIHVTGTLDSPVTAIQPLNEPSAGAARLHQSPRPPTLATVPIPP